MTPVQPTLRRERAIWQQGRVVVACDEVGRGALAGPVVIGAAVMAPRTRGLRIPEGLRDSKLIPEPRRAAMAQAASAWVDATALGWADAAEVDAVGIIRALGLAAHRALDAIRAQGVDVADAVVLLDGNHDYISAAGGPRYDVQTVIKGDRDCASASAASVVAKVARDAYMVALHPDAPAYVWDRNKGYASAEHRAAIAAHGLHAHHRASWTIAAAPTLF